MNDAKKEILANIRKALENVPEEETPADIEVPRIYRQEGKLRPNELVTFFTDRASEYKATVHQVTATTLPDLIVKICLQQNVDNLVVPNRFPEKWVPDGITPMYDNPESPLTNHELDSSDGVITTCTLAIAETGTIILDGSGGQGRRALTLLPDFHLCIVQAAQIVETVPEGFRHLEALVEQERSPITLISGPSATSDIELSRVEGVHGPRELEVIVYG